MQYIDKIKAYLAKQPTGEGGALLEILYFAFRDRTDCDERLNAFFELVETCVESLSFEKRNQIITCAVSVCAEQERVVFMQGITTGAQLAMELMGVDKCNQ